MTEIDLEVAEALDRTVTDLIDLGLVARQAQWMIAGPMALGLGGLLAELTVVARESSDRIGERSAVLGRYPDGRASTVALSSPLPQLEIASLRDADAVRAFRDILDIVVVRLFDSISCSASDPVTQSELVGVAGQIEPIARRMRSLEPR